MYEKAKEQLERGLKSRPDVPHFLSLLGEVERKMGNPAASLELNRKALARDATLTPAHYYIALADLDLKDEDGAIRELESSMASPYVVPEMYLTLATLYVPRGKLSEAEALCKKAIALDPTRAEAYVALARVYNAKGSSDQAICCETCFTGGQDLSRYVLLSAAPGRRLFRVGARVPGETAESTAVEAYSRAPSTSTQAGRRPAGSSRSLAQRAAFASCNSKAWAARATTATQTDADPSRRTISDLDISLVDTNGVVPVSLRHQLAGRAERDDLRFLPGHVALDAIIRARRHLARLVRVTLARSSPTAPRGSVPRDGRCGTSRRSSSLFWKQRLRRSRPDLVAVDFGLGFGVRAGVARGANGDSSFAVEARGIANLGMLLAGTVAL